MLLSVTFINDELNRSFTFNNIHSIDVKGSFVGVNGSEHFRTIIMEEEFDRIEIRKE